MKRSVALLSMGMIGAIAAMENKNLHITEPSPELPMKKLKKTPFNKQEGIVKIIEEYKLIQAGESKQGLRKQSRTISKVKDWLNKGLLTENDLK